jgi:hypothetical protein
VGVMALSRKRQPVGTHPAKVDHVNEGDR